MRESHGGQPHDGPQCAEGAIPPRNLSGTRTAWVWHSGGHPADRGGGLTSDLREPPVPDASPTIHDSSTSPAGTTLGEFVARHIGPDDTDVARMLEAVGHESL